MNVNQGTKNQDNLQETYFISFYNLRRLIGILGLGLPWTIWFANWFVNTLDLLNHPFFVNRDYSEPYIYDAHLKESVSHFYYTASGPLFVGVLMTLAAFLFSYKGYRDENKSNKWPLISDNLITNLAGFGALGTLVIPTSSDSKITDNIHIFVSSNPMGWIHYGFAALFLVSLAVMCLVNFRRQEKESLFGQDEKDWVYRLCGWGMLVSLALIVIFSFRNIKPPIANHVFWLEGIAVTFFGIAWLVKGRILEKDVPKKCPCQNAA